MSSALGDLATALVSRLPALLEQATAHETANGILFDECVELEARVALVRESIELERKKQSIVKAQLARLRVEPTGDVSPATTPSGETLKTYESTEDKENAADPDMSSLSQESPVSLRTKRKGMVFHEDVQIRLAKRMKFVHRDG